MLLFGILTLVFYILAIAFIIIALLLLRPVTTTKQTIVNTLQSAFDEGDGNVNVAVSVFPLSVISTREGIVKNAASLSNGKPPLLGFLLNSSVMANGFKVNRFVHVVSLQVICDYLRSTSDNARQVAIYNLDTREVLLESDVSRDDPIENGFFTHHLPTDQHITLTPQVNYAICALGITSDLFCNGLTNAYSSEDVSLLSFAFVPNTTLLQLPLASAFNPTSNNIMYASFQTSTTNKNATIFEVNPFLGYATFPINYVYNLNVQVQESGVQLEPGFGLNNMQNQNMFNNNIGVLTIVPTDPGVPNGIDVGDGKLEPEQWYAVFLITSSVQLLPPAGLLSKNQQDPLMPIGYDAWRRVGWARANDLGTNFLASQQVGNGTRRRTFYNDPIPEVFTRSFTPTDMETVLFFRLPLDKVSPSATSCVLRMTVNNPNSNPVNIEVRPIGSNVVPWFLTVPIGLQIQDLNISIPSLPVPHAVEIAVQSEFSIGSNVDVTVAVVSYFDDA